MNKEVISFIIYARRSILFIELSTNIYVSNIIIIMPSILLELSFIEHIYKKKENI